MKWVKLGKIFDPTDFNLANNCVQFAQSPQALVHKDFIRIYFSTREKDTKNEKYLSHIAFIDVTKDFRTVTYISDKTVIPLGNLGCFDEHGIFPMNVLKVGEKIYGYTCGWNRRKSVSVDTSIGLAISDDNGLTFQKVGDGPILTASLHEPFLVGDPFVNVYDGVFHMWYIFGVSWKRFAPGEAPDRIYKIGHASSTDGINWHKDEGRRIIADKINLDESQALPTVIKIGAVFHMFFCYRESYDFRKSKGRGYRIGHAFSNDLKSWVRDDEDPIMDITEGDWDSDMQCYPHVFESDGKVYLLYNGNEFGKYGFGAAVLE